MPNALVTFDQSDIDALDALKETLRRSRSDLIREGVFLVLEKYKKSGLFTGEIKTEYIPSLVGALPKKGISYSDKPPAPPGPPLPPGVEFLAPLPPGMGSVVSPPLPSNYTPPAVLPKQSELEVDVRPEQPPLPPPISPPPIPKELLPPPPPPKDLAVPPPPPPKEVLPPPPPPERKFYVHNNGQTALMPESQLRSHFVDAGGKDVPICLEGTQDWKTAADFGIYPTLEGPNHGRRMDAGIGDPTNSRGIL